MHRRTILQARHLRDDTDPTGGTPTGGGGTGAAAGADKGAGGDDKAGDNGFPENTPVADMTAEQQVAYWKHQARKHEQRAESRKDYDAIKAERDRIKAASQTEAERAIEQAKADAAAAATAAARAAFAPKLVAAKLEAALAGRMPADKIAGQVQFLDHTKFLTDAGEVDTDKVMQYAAGLAPAGGQWPDTGQGRRGTKDGPGRGVSAGADMFAASRGKKTT